MDFVIWLAEFEQVNDDTFWNEIAQKLSANQVCLLLTASIFVGHYYVRLTECQCRELEIPYLDAPHGRGIAQFGTFWASIHRLSSYHEWFVAQTCLYKEEQIELLRSLPRRKLAAVLRCFPVHHV